VSSEPRWLNKAALVLLHNESLALFGGPSGLRDEGLLDSALVRPVNLLLYRPDADLASLAAAYAYSLAQNHPFVDGNKRAAFLAIGLFLHINGQRLRASPVDAIQTIFALASGQLSEIELADWIRAHQTP
jgi:death on curing protein